MILTPSNVSDIERYYRGTFVKFQGFGDRLFYIQTVTNEAIHGQDDEGNDFILSLHHEAPFKLDYVLPHRAVFQYKRKVAGLERIPARQYRRGVCEDNTRVFKMSDDESLSLGFNTLNAFVNKPQYRSLKTALYGKGNDIEVAITPRFWFARPTQKLFLDRKVIATFHREEKVFSVNFLFKEDLERLIAADPFETKVVV